MATQHDSQTPPPSLHHLPDYEDVVERVSRLLALTDPAEVHASGAEQLARAYVAWCERSNQRLRLCLEHAYRGLVAEATHLARVEPALEKLVPALGKVDARRWAALCARLRLPPPPTLLTSALQELLKAAAKAAPLQELFARQRRLALAHAPLAERLAVLRQIAAADPRNPAWAEDLSRFEAARLAQIRAEARKPVSRDDVPRLQSLRAELGDAAWRRTSRARRQEVALHLERALSGGAVAALQAILREAEVARTLNRPAECERMLSGWKDDWMGRAFSSTSPLPAHCAAAIEDLEAWLGAEVRRREREARVGRAKLALGEQDAARVHRRLRRRRLALLAAALVGLIAAIIAAAALRLRH